MKRWKTLLPLLVIFSLNLLLLWGIESHYFWRQLTYWLLGWGLFFLVVRLNFSLENLANFFPGWYILGIVLLLLPLIFGSLTRGSSRWLFIKQQSFQPSEIAKPILIIFWASFLSRLKMKKTTNLLKVFVSVLIPVTLLLLQPSLGTAIVFVFSAGAMILFSKANKKRLFLILLLILPLVLLSGHFFLADYQKARVQNFLHPKADPLGGGYNLAQAIVAFGSGRFFGRGLGLGSQTRLFFLPERHTDFIFATLGESFGFFGAFLLLTSYASLFAFLWRQAAKEKGEFVCLLKVGLISSLWFQVVVNIGMNLGLMPVTGLPLPFFSYGGSSLLTSLISLGLIIKA